MTTLVETPMFKGHKVTSDLVVFKMAQWKNSFWLWFLDCVNTVDESENRIRNAPPWKYLKVISDRYQSLGGANKVLVVNKSRRMFMTHFWCARLLWSMIFEPYSENIIISINEDRGKELIEKRFAPMIRRLPAGFPWPEFKEKEHILSDEVKNPTNGARIKVLPSGSGKIRGLTVTNLLVDEFAFQKNCKENLQAIKPALEGPNCRAVVVSTPKFGTLFQELVSKIKKGSSLRHHMIGVSETINERDQVIMSIHYSADPAKRPLHIDSGTAEGQRWYDGEKAGCSEYEWMQEYELKFTVPTGKPCFNVFDNKLHCGPYKEHGAYIPDKPLHVGVDFGGHFPCAVFMQIDSLHRGIIHNAIMAEDEELENFLTRMRDFIGVEYPDCGDNFILYCDPSGAGSNQGMPPAAKELGKFFKKDVYYSGSGPIDRVRAINNKLARKYGDAMGFIINPAAGIHIDPKGDQRHGILVEGIEVGYTYGELREGQQYYKDLEPEKDGFYDHLMDAWGYIAIHTFPTFYERAREARTGRKFKLKKKKKKYLGL